MTNTINAQTDQLPNEIAELEGGSAERGVTTSQAQADDEFSDIIDAYRGELPSERARQRFHKDRAALTRPNDPASNYLRVSFPRRLADECGEFGWSVSTRYLLKLLAAAAKDPARSKSLSDWAELFEDGEGHAPEVEDGLLEYETCMEVYAEMEALMDASPEFQSRHARYHLKELREMVNDEAFGVGYVRALGVELGWDDGTGRINHSLIIGIGEAMLAVASDIGHRLPRRAVWLRQIVEAYYLDENIYLDVVTTDGQVLSLVDIESERALGGAASVVSEALERFPGSVSLEGAKTLRYSTATDELPYEMFMYWETEDDEPYERCLLVSPDLTLRAYVARADARNQAPGRVQISPRR